MPGLQRFELGHWNFSGAWMLVLGALKTLALGALELEPNTSDELEIILQPPWRGLVVVVVLYDQPQIERLVDRSCDPCFAVENPIVKMIHLRNPFGAFPEFRP